MRQENRVSYRNNPQEVEGWSEVSTSFLYIGPLVQTTSGNASKAIRHVGTTTAVVMAVGFSFKKTKVI